MFNLFAIERGRVHHILTQVSLHQRDACYARQQQEQKVLQEERVRDGRATETTPF